MPEESTEIWNKRRGPGRFCTSMYITIYADYAVHDNSAIEIISQLFGHNAIPDS